MKILFLVVILSRTAIGADAPEGLWQGYDGEWSHVSSQLVALAEATPVEKFTWRPAPGVRSTSEVFMHIALANFYLLSITGPKMPSDLSSARLETDVAAKPDVIAWLKRSLEAVKNAHLSETKKDLERRVEISNRAATVDGMYLRIIIHANEHMGQLIAYSRVNGVAPPWSENSRHQLLNLPRTTRTERAGELVSCPGDSIHMDAGVLESMKSKSRLETMLVSQMLVTHHLQMRFAGRAMTASDSEVAAKLVEHYAPLSDVAANQAEAIQKARGESPHQKDQHR